MVNVKQCSTARQNRLSTRTRIEVRPALEPIPYWSGLTAALNQMLWLPTGTDRPNADINHANGWTSKTATQSWFAVSCITAPNTVIHQIYSPTATRAAAVDSHASETKQQARRIRIYPNRDQKKTINTWLDASRWSYNLTAEILQSGIPAIWKHIASMVMPEIELLHPEWAKVPYQVKRTSVRDACRAMSNVKKFNQQLAEDHRGGKRLDEEFAELSFRSRKNPRQSCYIPDAAVFQHGIYPKIIGPLRMAEAIPAGQKECRLVVEQSWTDG